MGSIRARLSSLVPGVVRHNAVPLGLAAYAVVLFGVVGVLAYFGAGLPVDESAVEAVRDDPDLNVTVTDDGDWVLRDADADADPGRTGLVFYPGARVEPRSYLPVLAPLARSGGVTVVVPEMPINLAILDSGAAGRFLDRYPAVERWYVGGHSLGGAMACRYAAGNADRLTGMVLFGAYCADDASGTDLSALVVDGTRDGVLNRAAFADGRGNLPPGSAVVSVDGLNHTYFGSYSGQSGDDPATVTRPEAHRRLRLVVLSWLADGSLPGADWLAVDRTGASESGDRPTSRVRAARGR